MFLALNGHSLEVPPEDAIATVLAIAAGELDEKSVAGWLRDRANQQPGPLDQGLFHEGQGW